MGLRKGMTNNPAGRKKGTPNKVTNDLRQWVTTFIERNTGQIEKDWAKLKPQERIVLFEKLLKYCLPSLQSMQVETDLNQLSDEQLKTLINEFRNSRTK